MLYQRLCEGLGRGELVPFDANVYTYVKDSNKDYYVSLFQYNAEHYERFKTTGSVAGIRDTTTNLLYFDFDSLGDLEEARKDANEVCSRLLNVGVAQDCIAVHFTGNKGFSVELQLNKRITPEQFRAAVFKFAEDLPTFDKKVNDPNRIVRLPLTKHRESGLYKIPLSIQQLADTPSEMVKDWAKSHDINNDLSWGVAEVPEEYFLVDVKKERTTTAPEVDVAVDLDFKHKIKGFTNCKWALVNGFFDEGSRSHALMAIASTCKALSFPKLQAYHFCKSAAEAQAERTGSDKFPKEEIWKRVIEQVYGSNWSGAQYSCKTQPWLKQICDGLGHNKCKHEDKPFLESEDVFGIFKNYATNIEQNTIKFGIKSLDDALRVTTSQMMGILGAPASGKTSLSLNILNNTSVQGLPSLFLSLDMAAPILYQKLVHKVTGQSSKVIYDTFKNDATAAQHINTLVAKNFKNVKFSFRSGWSVEDIRKAIMDYQESTGNKLKLLLIDYAECLNGPYSDATANSAYNANALKDLTNDLDICTILLVQPQKQAGDASVPLTSMRSVKGSSVLEQAFSVLLGIYRDGFSPMTPDDDKYLTINCLKNRMGNLFSIDYGWNGVRGEIAEISEEEYSDLDELRKRKAAQKDSNKDSW